MANRLDTDKFKVFLPNNQEPEAIRLLKLVANRLNLEELEHPSGVYLLAAHREDINNYLMDVGNQPV